MWIEKINVLRFLCVMTLFFLSTSRSGAQSETIYSYWVSIGLGPIVMSDLDEATFGGSGRIAFSWSKSVVSLSAGGGGTTEVFGTNDEVTVLNACFGRLERIDSWILRFSGGPAYMNRIRRTSSLFSESLTQFDISEFGISAEVEAILHYKLLGVGLVVSGAISENISTLLLTLNVSLGSWR